MPASSTRPARRAPPSCPRAAPELPQEDLSALLRRRAAVERIIDREGEIHMRVRDCILWPGLLAPAPARASAIAERL